MAILVGVVGWFLAFGSKAELVIVQKAPIQSVVVVVVVVAAVAVVVAAAAAAAACNIDFILSVGIYFSISLWVAISSSILNNSISTFS